MPYRTQGKVVTTVADEMAELTEKSIIENSKKKIQFTIDYYPQVMGHIKSRCIGGVRHTNVMLIRDHILCQSGQHYGDIDTPTLLSLLQKDGFKITFAESNEDIIVEW